ncbi:MAG: hypothetical protein ACWA5R_03980 [bacterium]
MVDEKGWDSELFHAYLLIHQPKLKALLEPYLECLSKAFAALWILMDARKQQRSDTGARAGLHALIPESFYEAYISFEV